MADLKTLVLGRKEAVDLDIETELPHELMTVNMGPSHPAMHGTVRIVLTVDGERIISTVAADSLQVLDPGVCLANAHRVLTLDAMPSVIREAVEQGRLPGARRAHDGGELAPPDLQVHAIERPHRVSVAAVDLGGILHPGRGPGGLDEPDGSDRLGLYLGGTGHQHRHGRQAPVSQTSLDA